jgi:uncharacterized RDD family membrane protein YckC
MSPSFNSRTSEGKTSKPLDTVYDVVAPENASFQYRLAGPFIRAYAWFTDVAIILLWIIFVLITTILLFNSLEDYMNARGERILNAVFVVLMTLNIFYCTWFWNAVFEAFCRGRTPGKAILGLRTVSVSGRPIGFGQAFLRNVLRLADFMLGPFVLLIMGSNDRLARLGDLASGTIVVNERLQKKATPGIVFRDPKIVAVESNIPEDFFISERIHKALQLYVARRLKISPPRRYEIAAPLAGALARQSNFPYRVDPDAFLCALWQRATGDADKERASSRPNGKLNTH